MAEDAQEALPGLAFFIAQGAAEIGDDEKLMGFAFLTEAGAANAPATETDGKGAIDRAAAFAFEVFGEADVGGSFAEETFLTLGHETLGGTINEAEAMIFVEGENGDVE